MYFDNILVKVKTQLRYSYNSFEILVKKFEHQHRLYNIIIIIDTNNFIVTFTKLFNYCFRSLIVFLHSDLLF